MKTKILILLLAILAISAFSQESAKVKTLTITAGTPAAGWGSLSVDYNINTYYVTSAAPVTLSTNWTISALGSVYTGLTYNFFYDADVTLSGNTISFFGESLTILQSDKKLIVTAIYLASAWKVSIVPDLSSGNGLVVEGNQLNIPLYVDNSMVDATAGIVFSKMAAITASRVPVMDASGFIVPSNVTATEFTYMENVSSDIQAQIDTKPTSGTIDNSDITAAAAIDFSKMAALTASRAAVLDGSGFFVASAITATEIGYLTGLSSNLQSQLDVKPSNSLSEGYIYTGNSSNIAQSYNAKTNAYMLLGNGTTLLSVAMSGDATITNAGVLTVGAAKISPSNLTAEGAKEVITFNLSARYGIGTGIDINIPYACNLVGIYATVTDTPATDDLLLNFNNAGNADMVGSGLSSGDLAITFTSAVGILFSTPVTGNNVFAAGDKLLIDTKKSTPTTGGVLITLEFQRID